MADSERTAPAAAANATPNDADRAAFFAAKFPNFWLNGWTYPVFAAHVITDDDVTAIRAAAADAWNIYRRVLPLLQALPDETLQQAGIPAAARSVVRWPVHAGVPRSIVRFDFAFVDGRYRMLEINADTPYFIWESFEIAGAIATHFGFRDPNADEAAHLGRALVTALDTSSGRPAIGAYNAYREDWFTAHYLASLFSRVSGAAIDVVPLHELRVANGCLADERDAITALFRLYPLEAIAHDRDGAALFEAVSAGHAKLANPPWSLLWQTKMTQVIIWGLAASGAYFTPDECATVRRIFLPTFADHPEDATIVVEKPVLGREGDTVRILAGDRIVAAAAGQRYAAQPRVYQRYVDLSTVTFRETDGFVTQAKALYTAFVIDGEPSAIGLRVGGDIMTTDARFLPLALP